MTLTILNSTGQIFYRLSLYWDLSGILLTVRLGFEEEDHRGAIAISYQGDISSTCSVTVDADLDQGKR